MAAHTQDVLRVSIRVFGSLYEERWFEAGSVITIGAHRKSTLCLPIRNLPDPHPLIRFNEDGTVELRLNSEFTGAIETDGLHQPIASDLKVLSLPRGSRGTLEYGTASIFFEPIERPEATPRPSLVRSFFDRTLFRWIQVSGGVHFFLIAVVLLFPASQVAMVSIPPGISNVKVDSGIFRPIRMSEMKGFGVKTGDPRGGLGGPKAAGPEGLASKGLPFEGNTRKRGVLGILDDLSRHHTFKGIMASGGDDLATGARRFGLPDGREEGTGRGIRNLGGAGGGGNVGTIRMGPGGAGNWWDKKGVNLIPGGVPRADTPVTASLEEESPFISGNLSKDAIQKVIDDHIGRIRYCYEKELQVHPSLRGKIVTDFVIGVEGRVTVSKIKKSTVGNAAVEGCVRDAIGRILFPKPGGGVVEVIYPFMFRLAG